MVFRYYNSAVSQASRSLAYAILVIGLMLMGFGVVIIAMPEVFAFLAAAVFFIMGLGCAMTALKIYLAHRRMCMRTPESHAADAPRENVRIHMHREIG
jgi:hypothetical protein